MNLKQMPMIDPTYTHVDTLLSNCQTITESFERVAQASGENFNLFTILGLETKEVTTHSRFIAELLNPKGMHGRGEKFLELFLQMVKIDGFDAKGADVEVEKSFSPVIVDGALTSGRVDIYIESNGQIIMIENKIWAYEQVDQLRKYKVANRNGTLFFLTLNGEKSYQDDHDDINGKYHRISYREHIKNWLELCRKEVVEAPLLRESITLYINLVKKLTNQNVNKEMEKEIVDRVLRSSESFKAFRTLNSAYGAIIYEVRAQGLKSVIERVESDFGLNADYGLDFLKPKKKYAGVKFINEKLSKLNLVIGIHYEYDNGYGVMFTISLEKMDIPWDEEVTNRFKNAFGDVKKSDSYLCYLFWDKYPNWAEWDMLSAIHFGDFKKDLWNLIKTLYEVAINESLTVKNPYYGHNINSPHNP